MKKYTKPLVGMIFGVIVAAGMQCQTAQAVLLNTNGSSVLADALGANTGPEAITVFWSVTENPSLIYTYTFVVSNAVGDVVLNNNGSPSSTPEIVDAFSVGFDTTAPGAYIMNSQSGGVYDANNGSAGLFWAFAGINPGTVSGPMSFQSDQPPTLGNANAQDRNPPSPWSSSPNGQQVPVPTTIPEPPTTLLFALTGLFLLPFRSTLVQFVGRRKNTRSSQ